MATGSLGSLLVSLGLDTSEFTAGFTKAEYQAQQFANQFNRGMGQVKSALATLGVAVTVTQIVAYTRSLIDAADAMRDMSLKSMAAVESLGGIGLAAQKSGTDMGTVSQLLGRMNVKIAQAAEGTGDAAKAFKQMGISVKDSGGRVKDSTTLFLEVADALKGFEEGPNKAALAMAIFNRNYQSLLPLLEMGGKGIRENIDYYKKFGGTTAEVASQADELNDVLVDLDFVTGRLGREMLRQLLPGLTETAKALRAMAEESNAFETFGEAASIAFEAVAILGANVAFVLVSIGRNLGGLAGIATRFASNVLSGKGWEESRRLAQQMIDDLNKEDADRRYQLDNYERRLLMLGDRARNKTVPGVGDPGWGSDLGLPDEGRKRRAGGLGGDGADKVSEAQKYLDSLTKQVEQLTFRNEAEQLAFDIRKKMVGLTPELQKQMEGRIKEIEMVKEWTDIATKELELKAQRDKDIDALTRGVDAQMLSNEALREEVDLLGMESWQLVRREQAKTANLIADKEARLQLLEEMGAREDTIRLLKEEIDQLRIRQGLLGEKTDWLLGDAQKKEAEKTLEDIRKNGVDVANELGMTFVSAFEDAILAGKSLSDVLKGLAQDFLRIFLRETFTKPGAAAASGFFQSFDWQGMIGSFFGGMAGGTVTPSYGAGSGWTNVQGGRSGGGPVRGGGLYRVNENRMEGLSLNGEKFLLMGKQGGTIDNSPQVSRGGNTVAITFNIAEGVTADQFRRSSRQIESDLSRTLRRAGAIA